MPDVEDDDLEGAEEEALDERDIVRIVYDAIRSAVVEALAEIDIEGAILEGVRVATDECVEAVGKRLLVKQSRKN